MYSNLFLFTTASFHFPIYNINITFSATLTYFNIFHFTTASFHFLICNINVTFSPTLTNYNILIFTNACFTPLLYVSIEILIGGVTCCSTCFDCFIHKTWLFLRRLRCSVLYFVSDLFYLSSFSISAALCFLDCSSLIVSNKRHFLVNLIHPYYWTLVASNQRIPCYALLNHHFEPQLHICPD